MVLIKRPLREVRLQEVTKSPRQLILRVQRRQDLALHPVLDRVNHRQLGQHRASLLLQTRLLANRLKIQSDHTGSEKHSR